MTRQDDYWLRSADPDALAAPACGRPLRHRDGVRDSSTSYLYDGVIGRRDGGGVVMRQVIVFVNSSVDGFMGSPSGDLGWLIHDDEMDHDFTTDLRRTADTILSGRVVFESFAAAWPARAADRSGPPELVEFANWMLDTPKVVFSTRVTHASMKNSRIASRPIADEVAHLRDEAGGDMVVFGGARTVDAFVRLGLVDEFRSEERRVGKECGSRGAAWQRRECR